MQPQMRHVLKEMGLDEVRLKMNKPIVGACRERRARERPGSSTLPSVGLPGRFNEEVECDVFLSKHVAFDVADRCARRAAGQEIPDKFKDALLEASVETWGPPAKALYCDGEGGLNHDGAKVQLESLGAELRTRAPGQGANAIEARSGALRVVTHVME